MYSVTIFYEYLDTFSIRYKWSVEIVVVQFRENVDRNGSFCSTRHSPAPRLGFKLILVVFDGTLAHGREEFVLFIPCPSSSLVLRHGHVIGDDLLAKVQARHADQRKHEPYQLSFRREC